MGRTEFYRALGPANATWFDDTNWSVVRRAGQPELPQADAARANLCRTYWHPIYHYIRSFGHGHEDAQDLTQAFFARFLEKNYVRPAALEKGKFRTYLLTMVKRFLADEWDHAHCQKRGGGLTPVSINAGDTEIRARNEPVDPLSPDKLFDRAWVESLLEQALADLEQECSAAGKGKTFQELRAFVTCDSEVTYTEEARKLGLTVSNLKVTVHRLRQRLRELLRVEIAKTARTSEEVDEELRELYGALSASLHPE